MQFVIVGCGRMGSGIAQTLSMRGHSVAVIDNNESAFQRLGHSFKGKILLGHAMERAFLEEAGLAHADGLAAVTGSDDVNTIVALVARQHFQVPKVVARLYDPNKAEVYRRLGITTIAPTSWAIASVTEQMLFPQLRVLTTLGNGAVDLIELEIPPTLAGRTLADLAVPQELQAVALQRGGKTFFAAQNMPLQPADIAYIAILPSAVDHINTQLGIT
jgi:trk system potassium uptake protein